MLNKLKNYIKKFLFALWLWRNGLNLGRLENIARKYIDSLNLQGKGTNQQFFIGLIGSYGTGKTTIAKRLTEKLPLVMVSSDEIRRLLEYNNIPHQIIENQKLLFFVGLKFINELIKKRINIILDADLRETQYREALQKIFNAAGYKIIILHITAPEKLVLGRIKTRREKERSQYLKINLERHYQERQKIHSRYPLPQNIFYTFTNNDNLDSQINEMIQKFKQLGL